jgi:hypothetical protein
MTEISKVVRAENYTLERINAKCLNHFLMPLKTQVTIATSYPRGSFAPPVIVVAQPFSQVHWAGFGGYGGGTPQSSFPDTLQPRTVGESGVKTHGDITTYKDLRMTGTVIVTAFADVPDVRDKLITYIIGAYMDALETGWFSEPANCNENYNEANELGNLIRFGGFWITAVSKQEFTQNFEPKYVYAGDITINFNYHVSSAFYRAVISGVEQTYDIIID